ncbi:TIGR03620 family F420-dependent LLM class oxidoreductase [Streptomyces scopuliridis]|uniref:Luciferase-like domain-containing protein n=1 Tax=Streptomyces scopuliridis RB72 TaxID=1440053 RepID=A0A2T7TES0_9ACTN|nr:TIGR03620 family F420-dependent LLM class oxidoreductase [Streptomyces scopuliridis]PVE13663.1 hypothetical protein Y717_14625 [Streptomyces scopuliridis RB72]
MTASSAPQRAHIGFTSRIGVMCALDGLSTPDAQKLARDIENMGYASLFFPEGGGKESLTQAAALLAATQHLVIGTGIANIHLRDAVAAEAGGRALSAMYPGRFVLGLGVSHQPMVEGRLNKIYEKPLATMRNYLERMASVPGHIDQEAGRPPRILAALGPKMIELSGSDADGAMPYLVTPEQTRFTRERLGPERWVISEQGVTIGGDTEQQLQRAYNHLHIYDGFENYRASWRRQGFNDSDFAPSPSEHLARSMVAMGGAESVVAIANAHLDAGADHVVLQAIGNDLYSDPRQALAEIAAALELERV